MADTTEKQNDTIQSTPIAAPWEMEGGGVPTHDVRHRESTHKQECPEAGHTG